jgi:hypothetical protein
MESNEKKIAIMVVEETEVKKPEKKIVTVEYTDAWGEVNTHILRLTPEQYRLLEWLEEHEMLSESLEWHDGEPKVEIEEI